MPQPTDLQPESLSKISAIIFKFFVALWFSLPNVLIASIKTFPIPFAVLLLGSTLLATAVDSVDIQAELEQYQNNFTTLNTIPAPPLVSAPSLRGTTSILYSCVVTLFACIYTAIHLNVPQRGSSAFQNLQVKLTWVLMALLAPEIVLYLAISQCSEARDLINYLNRSLDDGGDQV